MRLIDADVLIDHLLEVMKTANHFGNIERVSEIGGCIGVVQGEKTIERPHGERKAHYIKGENGEWYCSHCKRIDDKYSVARFCWYCGAEMQKEGEAE